MRKKYKYLVALLVLLVAAVLAAGAVFARYSASVKGNIPFSVFDSEYLNICGTVTSETAPLPPAPAAFVFTEEGDARLAFSVVNAKTSTDICANDLEFSLYLTVTDGFNGDGRIALYLTDGGTVTEDSVPYIGKITKTKQGSALYNEQGPGYVCRFYDETGNEKTFDLKGGRLSAKNFVLSVNGDADTSLFRLSAIPTVK